jgi:hypothetical protein
VADSFAGEGPVLLLPAGVLYTTAGELRLRRQNGSEAVFRLTGASVLTQASAEYAAIRSAEGTFLLRLALGSEQLWQLPEPAAPRSGETLP